MYWLIKNKSQKTDTPSVIGLYCKHQLNDNYKLFEVVPESCHQPFTIAELVNKAITLHSTKKNISLTIDVELSNTHYDILDYLGVRLIEEFRVNYSFTNSVNKLQKIPIIAISTLLLKSHIKEDLRNTILCAPGTLFGRSGKDSLYLELEKEHSEIENLPELDISWLKPFLNPRIDFEESGRHNLANQFAAQNILNIHNTINHDSTLAIFENPILRKLAFSLDYNPSFEQILQNNYTESKDDKLTLENAIKNSMKEVQKALHIKKVGKKQEGLYELFAVIDDQGHSIANLEAGWTDVISKMIFGKKGYAVDILSEIGFTGEKRNFDVLAKQIVQNVKKDNYRCILLDLNLTDNEQQETEKKTGAKLFKILKKEFPSLPIVIITASNKSWRKDKMLKLGADAFWIKEGLDENRGQYESVRNYLRLLEILKVLVGEEYQYLKRMGDAIELLKQKLKKGSLYWSVRYTWTQSESPRRLTINYTKEKHHETVLNVLEGNHQKMRTLLRNKLTQHNSFDEEVWIKSIIQQFSFPVEIIHNYSTEQDKYIGVPTLIDRNDKIGFYLYKNYRNLVAHPNRSYVYKFGEIKDMNREKSLTYFTSHILSYLLVDHNKVTSKYTFREVEKFMKFTTYKFSKARYNKLNEKTKELLNDLKEYYLLYHFVRYDEKPSYP